MVLSKRSHLGCTRGRQASARSIHSCPSYSSKLAQIESLAPGSTLEEEVLQWVRWALAFPIDSIPVRGCSSSASAWTCRRPPAASHHQQAKLHSSGTTKGWSRSFMEMAHPSWRERAAIAILARIAGEEVALISVMAPFLGGD